MTFAVVNAAFNFTNTGHTVEAVIGFCAAQHYYSAPIARRRCGCIRGKHNWFFFCAVSNEPGTTRNYQRATGGFLTLNAGTGFNGERSAINQVNNTAQLISICCGQSSVGADLTGKNKVFSTTTTARAYATVIIYFYLAAAGSNDCSECTK